MLLSVHINHEAYYRDVELNERPHLLKKIFKYFYSKMRF